jgi:hypothetical protein
VNGEWAEGEGVRQRKRDRRKPEGGGKEAGNQGENRRSASLAISMHADTGSWCYATGAVQGLMSMPPMPLKLAPQRNPYMLVCALR